MITGDLFKQRPGADGIFQDLGRTTGTVFYVDSVTGASGNDGLTPYTALATIDQAINKTTASKGDVIYVMPGHAETIVANAGIALDVAGVSIIGLGNAGSRPVVTLGTATTADVEVSAAGCRIENIRFVCNIDSLVEFIAVTAANVEIKNCAFATSSTKEALGFITATAAASALRINGCKFTQPTDPTGSDGAVKTGAIYIVGADDVVIESCLFQGAFETALVHVKTTAATNLFIFNCRGIQALAGAECTLLPAGTTGMISGSQFIVNTAGVTEAATWGTLPAGVFVDINSCVGNDGANGQLMVPGATAAT